jgi:uncharacterized membrane protein
LKRILKMNRRDDELLAKQMRAISPPRNDVGLALLAVFVAGLVAGAMLFANRSEPAAPHDVLAAMSLPAGTAQSDR